MKKITETLFKVGTLPATLTPQELLKLLNQKGHDYLSNLPIPRIYTSKKKYIFAGADVAKFLSEKREDYQEIDL
jgi:hypothetical protein